MQGLEALRYTEPTPIQEKSIPLLLKGNDIIGSAQTGTGKTGAFVIPLLEMIMRNKNRHEEGTQALILSPTRELAQQIDEQIFAIGYHTGISSATVIGGSDFSAQAKAIRAGVDLIVATPGRLIDQIKVMNIDFGQLKYLVLDEADRMLDMGFMPDVMKIVRRLPKERQTMLFSATMPKEIERVAREIQKKPERIEIATSKPADSVEQRIYFLQNEQKIVLIQQLFDTLEWDSAIIFTKTKRGTDQLERLLHKKGIKAASMHGDRSQEERNKALYDFKNGTYPVMVATDVLARGIDIDDISMIINYDVPQSPDDYIHRIGRTGRYDKSGLAITFVTPREKRSYGAIKKVVGDQLNEIDLPESLTTRKSKKAGKGSQDKKRGKKSDQKKDSGKDQKGSAPKESSRNDKKDNKGQQQKKDSNRKDQNKQDQKKKDNSSQSSGRRSNGKQQQKQEDTSRDDQQSGGDNRNKSRNKRSRRSSKQNKRHKRAPRKIQSDNNRSGQGKQEPKRVDKKNRRSSKKSNRNDNRKSNRNRGRNQSRNKKQSRKQRSEKEIAVERVDKAIERNKNAREPAKGVWGIIKSMIPKIK